MAGKGDGLLMPKAEVLPSNPNTTTPRRRARALAAACAAHVLHDGYTDLLYVLLPIWKVEFALGYAALALLRATYSGVMAAAQVPIDRITRPLGVRASLVGGTLLAAVGFMLAGISHGTMMLCASLAIAGLGSSTQHPRASAIVTQTFGERSRSALGVYNFAGDLGKTIFPTGTALLLIAMTWHSVTYVIAAIGVIFAAALVILLPSSRATYDLDHLSARPLRSRGRGGFWVLFAIGALDTATRMGFLLFLPFILAEQQVSHATIGLAFALVFAGGAFGKVTCGWLGERLGLVGTVAITEGATAVMILAVPALPVGFILPLLPVLGVALNGTSSVLYGTVPDVATDDNVSRAFALFYTGVIGAGALAPVLFGALADHAGRYAALIATASTALSAIPLAVVLHEKLRERKPAF